MVSLESLELGDIGVSETDALSTFKDTCVKAGLDEKVHVFLVKTVGCRILEDLEKISESAVDDKLIPAIENLQQPILQASRLKKLIAAVVQASALSWDKKKRGIVEDEDTPLPAPELRRLEALFWARHKIRIAAEEDAGETVVSRLKRQLDKSTLRFEQVLKTKTRKGETAEGKVKRTRIGANLEMVEKEVAEQNDPKKKVTVDTYLDGLFTYIIGLARAGIEQCSDKPTETETEMSKSWEYVHCPLDVVWSYHARAKRFAATLPKDRALQILQEVDEAERLLWTERAKTSKVGAVIQAVMQERAHVWVWHEKPGESSRSEAPPGNQFRGGPQLPPRPPSQDERRKVGEQQTSIVGTWATSLKGGKALCAAYQKGHCGNKNCSKGEHVCAVITRNSGHVCGLKHPACEHSWKSKKG